MAWIQSVRQTTQRGRWRREYDDGRCRYYVYVGPFRLPVPRIAWALFS